MKPPTRRMRFSVIRKPTTVALCALLGCVPSAALVGCGASSSKSALGTETGNPPWLDVERIEVVEREDGVQIVGRPGAVPDGATVVVENESNGDSATVQAEADGSFEATLEGDVTDSFVIQVEDGESERLQFSDSSDTDGAETDTDGTETDTDGAETDIDGTETDIDGAETDIDGTETDIDGTETDIDTETDGTDTIPDIDPPPEECNGPGQYEVGKNGGYLPCCEGLHEVFQLDGAYNGDGEPICVQALIRLSACIEGECGDGLCEVGEDVPCGCVEDCPDAAWGAPLCEPTAVQTEELLQEYENSLEVSCVEHADCSRVALTTPCSTRRCSGAQAPAARSDLERAAAELQSIEALCTDEIAAVCINEFPECAQEEPWISMCNAGSCERLYSCDNISTFIDDEVAARAASIDGSCTEDADCVYLSGSTSCGNPCLEFPVASADEQGIAGFGQWLRELDETVCGGEFVASGCTLPPGSCAAPADEPVCLDNLCQRGVDI